MQSNLAFLPSQKCVDRYRDLPYFVQSGEELVLIVGEMVHLNIHFPSPKLKTPKAKHD